MPMTPLEQPIFTGGNDTLPPRESSPTVAAPEGAAGCKFKFLAPAEGPDELGRLGPYRVLKVLGSGGMGVVFLAEDTKLIRRVALKAMLPSMAKNQESRERFLREARVAASVNNDHVVTIYQVDEANGAPFFAMEFLEGEPLEEWLRRVAIPPVSETLRIARETAEGLAAAHDKGLIHRDIKPGNIWIENRQGESRVKLLDFGVARPTRTDANLTVEGAVIGTPAFMAPEQAHGRKLDCRSDLFSLGCVLYRMGTGRLPFKGEDTMSTLISVATDEPTPPLKLNPDLPPQLADLIVRMLAKKPGGRPPSARAVANELSAIEQNLAKKSAAAKAPQPPLAPTILFSTKPVVAVPRPAALVAKTSGRRRKRKRSLLPFVIAIAVAAVSALLAIGVGLMIYRGSDKTVPSKMATDSTAAPLPEAKPELAASTRPDPASKAIPSEKKSITQEAQPKPADASPKQPTKPVEINAYHPPEKQIVPDPISPILIGNTAKIVQVKFLASGRRAVSLASDGTIRIWNLISGKAEKTFSREKTLDCFDIAPDLKHLALGGSAHKAHLLDIDTGKPGPTILPFTAGVVSALAYSDDGSRLYVGLGTGRLWAIRTADGEHVQFQHILDTALSRIRLLPGGRQALCSSMQQGQFVLWDFAKGEVRRFDGAPTPHRTLDIALFADGRRAASIDSDGSAHIWSIDTAAELAKFKAHQSKASGGYSIHVLPGDKWLLTTGEDKIIRMWDAKSLKKLHELKTDALIAAVCDVSPDGRSLLTGAGWRLTDKPEDASDFNLRLWRLPNP
jgi:serine/threonine protein kinase